MVSAVQWWWCLWPLVLSAPRGVSSSSSSSTVLAGGCHGSARPRAEEKVHVQPYLRLRSCTRDTANRALQPRNRACNRACNRAMNRACNRACNRAPAAAHIYIRYKYICGGDAVVLCNRAHAMQPPIIEHLLAAVAVVLGAGGGRPARRRRRAGAGRTSPYVTTAPTCTHHGRHGRRRASLLYG